MRGNGVQVKPVIVLLLLRPPGACTPLPPPTNHMYLLVAPSLPPPFQIAMISTCTACTCTALL